MNGPSPFGNGAPMPSKDVKEALDRFRSNPKIAPFIKDREVELANLGIDTSGDANLEVHIPEENPSTNNHPPVPKAPAERPFSETKESPELKVVRGPDGKISWERANE